MVINDGPGSNKLVGTPGADTINGNGGNDTISGGAGANRLNGGAGNDRIDFAFDFLADTITGGAGIDTLAAPLGMTGPVTMAGNLATGANLFAGGRLVARASQMEALIITASNFNDRLLGGNGNDSINTARGRDTVTTGAGNDTVTLTLDVAADSINTGAGIDRFIATYGGTGDIDMIMRSGTARFILDQAAAGTVTGAEVFEVTTGAGNDTLEGGNGADIFDVGLGANSVFGGIGNDIVSFTLDNGLDHYRGGRGDDRIQVVNDGNGRMAARLVGPGFYDVSLNGVVKIDASGIEAADVFGGSANDIIDGLVGSDNLVGNGGNDTIAGGGGNDNILGRAGDDSISGDLGNDQIEGGLGDDRLEGRTGNDRFIFASPAEGRDTVLDLRAEDFVVVRAAGFPGLVPGRPVALVTNADPEPPPNSTRPVFLYEIDTGLLAFDRDGDGAAAAQIFANLRIGTNGSRPALLDDDQILVI